MRYTSRQYGAALLGTLEGKTKKKREEVLRHFFSLLRKNRDTGRLSAILREVERIHLRKEGLKKVEIESAAPLTREIKKETSRLMGGKAFLREYVKPDLLAGAKILVNDELLIDASARRRLRQLFLSNGSRHN